MNKLYAEYHKIEFRPPKGYSTAADSIARICDHLGIDSAEIEPRSLSAATKDRANQPQTPQYKTTDTFRRVIDFEYTNSPKHGRSLSRVVIQGEAFTSLNLDTGRILTGMESDGFVATEAHSRILLPSDFVSWDTIDAHFKAEAYTASCKIVSPLTDPQNNYAKTWQAGKRPKTRSANTQGKRLTFYQADKIHLDLPAGTTTMELQLFGDTAHKFLYSVPTRDVDLTLKTIGVIRGYFEFKALAGDTNKFRRPTADFWKKVVENIPAIHLPAVKRADPQLDGQIKKFKQELFSRYQKLGIKTFSATIADFAQELGFTEVIANELIQF